MPIGKTLGWMAAVPTLWMGMWRAAEPYIGGKLEAEAAVLGAGALALLVAVAGAKEDPVKVGGWRHDPFFVFGG